MDNVFTRARAYPTMVGANLLDALDWSGGPEVEDMARCLVHHGVAALLNAAYPDIGYPRSVDDVIDDVNAALNSRNRDIMEDLKDELDYYNNLGD